MSGSEREMIPKDNEPRDGEYFCACRTTHVVCRPSCLSKRCKPENIIRFRTLEEAIRQGYHPCQKCCPQIEGWKGAKYELAAQAGRIIEDSCQEKFSLDRIADQLHVNKSYLARTFREMRGGTMLNYHHFCRCELSKRYLEKQEFSVETIAFKVGYMTSSHYVRTFRSICGMTPLQYRRQFERSLTGFPDQAE